MKYLRKVWWYHFTSSRYCVSCRFCQNSFCHFYQPPCALEENFLWIWARRVRESGWSSGIACCGRSWRNWWRCEEGDTHQGLGCRCCLWCSRVGDLRVGVAVFHFHRDFPGKRTGGTDCVWVWFWHRSTSAMWVFKSSYLISFWFAGIIWRPLIFSKS